MDRPWFLWDVEVSDAEFRERLAHPDARIRAQWQGALMREATYREVWKYLTLKEILGNYEHIKRHLGRRRAFWEWLFDGWRKDGILDSPPADRAPERPAT